MKHVRYTSSGNTVGLEETIEDYWEISDDGHVVRSINLQVDGSILKYDSEHDADSFGALPEGIIEDSMLADTSRGKAIQISHTEFESLWSKNAKNENH
jgi:hypothetical protein